MGMVMAMRWKGNGNESPHGARSFKLLLLSAWSLFEAPIRPLRLRSNLFHLYFAVRLACCVFIIIA